MPRRKIAPTASPSADATPPVAPPDQGVFAARLPRTDTEWAANRVARLQELTAALSNALTPAQVATVVIRQGSGAIGADAGALVLRGAEGLETVAVNSSPTGGSEPQTTFSLNGDDPIVDAVLAGNAVWAASRAEYVQRYPHLEDTLNGATAAVAAVPLLAGDRAIGAIMFSFAEPQPFWPEDRALLLALAQQCTQAIERARLYEAEQRARAAAEAAHHRQAGLAEASRLFAEASLDLQEVLDRVTRQVAERIGDFCAIRLISADRLRLETAALYHPDPAAHALVAATQSQPYGVDEGFMGQVVQTGRALRIPVVSPEEARRGINRALSAHLDQFGLHSLLMVPLRVGGEVIGAVGVTRSTPGRPYTEEDQVFLQDLADRAALAIDHARLYQVERQARAAAERATARMARLQAVAAALSGALTPAQVAEVIVAQGVAALEAHAGIVMLIDHGRAELELVSTAGYAQADVTPYARFSLHDPLPLADVARTGTALWFESGAELLAHYPTLAATNAVGYEGAFAALPLRLEEQMIGVFSLRFAGPRAFAAEDQTLMLTLAQQCAQALERARLYREAQDAIRLRDVFFSVAAHELKTPLTSLLGQAQLLQRRTERTGSLDERDRRSVAVVVEQVARLNKMVTAMLDISRIELGKLSIEREVLDLGALTRRVVEEVQPTLRQHTVVCEEPGGPLLIAGDALRLEQVLQNLIGNAVKYSPAGGPIRVQVARRGPLACVTVQDRGIGIPEAALPQLFQRFYRAGNVDERQFSGMGIGLYVVKEIVALHDGTVTVESAEGQGSRFTFCLPIREPSAA